MILKTLTLRGSIGIKTGLGQDEITVDFRKFGPGLIVLIGPNGAGKTTLIENLTPYRELHSRPGSLARQFFLKDSYRDLLVEIAGDEYRFRININGESAAGKIESYVIKNGETLNKDGLEAGYNEIVYGLFGKPDVFFSSLFMPQHRVPWQALKPAVAKEFLLDLIGAGRIQKKCDHAKGQADLVGKDITSLTATIRAIEGSLAGADDIDARILAANDAIAAYEVRKVGTQATIVDLTTQVASLQTQATGQAVTTAKIAELQKRYEGTARDGGRAREAALQSIKKLGDQIVNDQTAADNLRLLVAPERRATIEARIFQADRAEQAYEATIESRTAYDAAQTKVAELQASYATERAAHDQAGTKLITDQRTAVNALATAKATFEHRRQNLTHQINVATRGAGILPTVPCQQLDPATAGACSSCQFLTDAIAAKGQLETLEKEATEADQAWAKETTALADVVEATTLAAAKFLPFEKTDRGRELITQGSAAKEAMLAIGFDPQEGQRLKAVHESFVADDPRIALQTLETRQERLEAIDAKITTDRTAQVERQAAWEVEAARFDEQLATIEAEVRELTATIDLTVDTALASAKRNLEAANQADKDLTGELSEWRTILNGLGAEKLRLGAATQDIEGHRGKLGTLQADLADWDDLNQSLGRTSGFQSMLVENAGAQMTPRANELLALYERPWTIEISTSRPTADGKKMTDGFFITVNTPTGSRDLNEMSGGEEVILDQVIYDAVGDYLRRMSGLTLQTAIKDEADGPLDPERAGKYLAAVQAYLQISGLHQVLMISHREDIQQQISQRLVFEPGQGIKEQVA